ncbi:MAG: hypothetical protein DI565_00545 [Ancylobacter novellus]|uniref:Uncharacterized protein n=1 Tax=Ancylobacter novellus TaxID=921 RepID=A0A2W5KS41_ANCNO|nr:MAG: hypothetical protein DI565_00545 [Ancylobacter novellus]
MSAARHDDHDDRNAQIQRVANAMVDVSMATFQRECGPLADHEAYVATFCALATLAGTCIATFALTSKRTDGGTTTATLGDEASQLHKHVVEIAREILSRHADAPRPLQ